MSGERGGAHADVLAKIDKAFQHVFDICKGKEKWTMRIPARPDMDSDLIICDALNAARTALSARAEFTDESIIAAFSKGGGDDAIPTRQPHAPLLTNEQIVWVVRRFIAGSTE